MKVLVTGASGYLGSRASRRLAEAGHEVFALALPGEPVPAGTRPLAADLSEPASLKAAVAEARPELALHLAWYAEHGRFWTSPRNADCVGWSLNLARALAEAGCRRLVAAGSCAEYDWSPASAARPLSEAETPLRPSTFYGVCKNALRSVLEPLCREAGLGFAWGRFFYLYGGREQAGRLVPTVTEALLKGERPRLTHGRQVRDFLHADDAAAAFCALALSPAEGAVNLASGRGVPLRELAAGLARAAGRPDAPEFGALRAPEGEPERLVADVGRLSREVGWSPSLTLEAGLERTWREAQAAPAEALR